jgi:DNA polymerase-3 subunit gamma/tau
MFRRTHNNHSQEKPAEEQHKTIGTAATAAPEVKVATLTSEQLQQKWMEYALRLPENERALADRMKIITPEIIGENQFVIKVGNSLVMEFFTKEIKAITQYIEDGTKCRNVTMKIEIEEQQTRRRIYDRTEQFKLLTEKNPALEKLRKNLNLDFA